MKRSLVACALVCAALACTDKPAANPDGTRPGIDGPSGPSGDPFEPTQPFAPADARMRRLLSWQYENAVRDILGADAAAVVEPPADVPLNGFTSVGSATLSLSPTDVEKVETSAYAAAQVAVHGEAPQSWRVCAPASFDDADCASQSIAALGRRVFRRPLTDDELARWNGIAAQAAQAYGDFDMGLEYAVAGMLQSPNFLYLVEVGVPDPSAPEGARRLTGLEVASRLSFFLVGTTPSDELLDAAERGDLDTREGVRLWAETLLGDTERAKDALHHFFDEKLGLGVVLTADRPSTGITESVRAAMREETLRFIDDIVWDRNADARELFTSDATFVNDELAAFYGLPLPGTGPDLVKVQLKPESRRAGLFTQGSFLLRFAHEHRSAPTLRGKFIRESVMCQAIPAPPNDVNTVLPEPTEQDEPQTTRDRLAAHMTEERCASCHAAMDPIGFAYEEFDEAGRFRTHENGLPINSATDLDGAAVDGAVEMANALKSRREIPDCLVRNLFRQGTGHIDEFGEDPSIYLVTNAFEDAGYRLQDALLEIATSDAFRLVAVPEGAQ